MVWRNLQSSMLTHWWKSHPVGCKNTEISSKEDDVANLRFNPKGGKPLTIKLEKYVHDISGLKVPTPRVIIICQLRSSNSTQFLTTLSNTCVKICHQKVN